MPSFRTAVVAAAILLASVARADYYIDPDSVSLATRKSWCQSEISTCPLICQQVPPGSTEVNTCDAETLTYGCVCGNGLQPNISEYSLTLPYFVCSEWGNQCVANCGQDNACSSSCRQDHPCGALNPSKPNTTSSATMSATATSGTASTTADQIFTGVGGSTSTASAGAQGNMVPAFGAGSTGGLLIVCASMFAGFALML